MAVGYTRQKAAQITAGATITDTDLEAEYDAIVAAFNASSGHNHNGTVGGGALIPLTTGVTGTLPLANGGTNATSASTARTSLGLVIGTDVQAYDVDTAKLDVIQTWTAAQTYSAATAFNAQATFSAAAPTAISGVAVFKSTASGTGTAITYGPTVEWTGMGASDTFNFLNVTANSVNIVSLTSATTSLTPGSETMSLDFKTIQTGTLATRMSLNLGLQVGSPTGGDKGAGTINAVGVYDDNVLLTDYVFDKYAGRELQYEDERMQDNADMFNPDALDINYYSEYWRINNHLLGMPSQESFYKDTPSTGRMIQRLWETVEVQAVHIHKLNERLKAVEATKKCECN